MLQRINRRRGMTLVEVMISLVLMLLLSIITIGGMMMHARMARANLTREQIAESSRRLVSAAQVLALDATVLRVDAGPSGANTVLTIETPDPADSSVTIIKQFAYIDRDMNPNTIGDNVVVERDTNSPGATTGKVIMELCSVVGTKKVFEQPTGTARPLININLRLGDRTSPAGNADNAFTGPGYQSFLISASVSQLL